MHGTFQLTQTPSWTGGKSGTCWETDRLHSPDTWADLGAVGWEFWSAWQHAFLRPDLLKAVTNYALRPTTAGAVLTIQAACGPSIQSVPICYRGKSRHHHCVWPKSEVGVEGQRKGQVKFLSNPFTTDDANLLLHPAQRALASVAPLSRLIHFNRLTASGVPHRSVFTGRITAGD